MSNIFETQVENVESLVTAVWEILAIPTRSMILKQSKANKKQVCWIGIFVTHLGNSKIKISNPILHNLYYFVRIVLSCSKSIQI